VGKPENIGALGREKRVRRKVRRTSQSAIGNVHRDPIELLQISSVGRVERLVPLRYGRMIASPFAFYRGSAIIQAHDLASTPNSGLTFQICGDCHLANFGAFATPERALIFDLNDFDETSPGPWEWDLKRLCASFVVAARHLNHKRGTGEELVRRVVKSYQVHMAEFAGMSLIETWYERITFERLMAIASNPDSQRRLKRGLERAMTRTSAVLLPKLSDKVDGQWVLRDSPPAIFHIKGKNSLFGPEDDWLKVKDLEGAFAKSFKEYLDTLAADRRRLLSHFTPHDMAFKVVGVGSVGTRCLVRLLIDRHGKPLFLQSKEASKSVVARFFKSPAVTHEGRRVVEGQRLMQAASDPFLGWTRGPGGRPFYLRQLRDMKLSAEYELMNADTFSNYGALCGWALARGHAKAGGLAKEISDYIGTSDRLADALVKYSETYANQVERDYEHFVRACRSGRLEARTDLDMAADFRV
jgi:uncharacterized protein (DUF2252 family)